MSNLLTIKEWQRVAKEADFSAARMASLCSISQRQLQRLFQHYLHCTPSRWLRELQCHLAKELIARGYSNKRVAAELRFASESHFCRVFKKAFGSSPQTFAPNQGNSIELQIPQ
jgi:AraC-like DNA-binding protein